FSVCSLLIFRIGKNMTRNETNIENSSFFDEGPEEPELCSFSGYDDCETCYFRLDFVKRTKQDLKQSEA
ncbi:MAG: hypothetical protein QUS12_04170, partial [Methanosarcina sp.]|nr:hypothetical protein [Methanosarcina sp.]